MTRLAKKDERYIGDYCCIGSLDINWKEKAYFKLGQLEDIEEELDIDLIKAIELCKQVNSKKVVYTKEKWGIDTLKFFDDLDIELFNHRLYSNARGIYVSLDLYEYGKIWALTKEELL